MNTLIENLKTSNCIKNGNFILKNGEHSKYYFDMKNLVSHPRLLSDIGDKIYKNYIEDEIKDKKNKIRICGVPLGGLPIATYISTKYNIPMIMLRDKIKNYGTQKQIEGEYSREDNCIIIEDVITTGNSVKESIDILKDKINIMYICAILNRSDRNVVGNYKLNYLLNKKDFI